MKTVGLATVVGFLVTVGVPIPARAGIADSPLPVLQAGLQTLRLYSVPGLQNGGGVLLGAYFSCTSTSTSTMVVSVEVFGAGGGSAINNAATDALTVPPGGTVRFGTAEAVGLFLNGVLHSGGAGIGTLEEGSARILSTSKSLICTAFLADFNDVPPNSMVELTIVAKTKQKAAN